MAVTDRDILDAYRRVAREGLFAEPASAASVAGLLHLLNEGRLPRGGTVVCVLTGHGLKDPEWAVSGAAHPPSVARTPTPSPRARVVTVRLTAHVPATSANLGPGFDCFGLALDLVNEVTLDTSAESGVSWEGEGAAELPTDGSDLVTRAIAETAQRHGLDPPTGSLHGVNAIPLERGLGSSAAAVVAGVALADGALGLGMEPTDVLEVAASIEGIRTTPRPRCSAVHHGRGSAGRGSVRPRPRSPARLLVPEDLRISTEEARRVLPAIVGRTRWRTPATRRLPRSRSCNQACSSRRCGTCCEESLGLVPPGSRSTGGPPAGLPVCVSGSGPTLLAFEDDEHEVPISGRGGASRHGCVRTGVQVVQG
jgi:homoserine kinase